MVFVSVPGWDTTILLPTIPQVTKGTALSSSHNDFSSVTPFVPCFYRYVLCAVARLWYTLVATRYLTEVQLFICLVSPVMLQFATFYWPPIPRNVNDPLKCTMIAFCIWKFHPAIIGLQETHLTRDTTNCLHYPWVGKEYHSTYSAYSHGVSVLVHKALAFQDLDSMVDSLGCFCFSIL